MDTPQGQVGGEQATYSRPHTQRPETHSWDHPCGNGIRRSRNRRHLDARNNTNGAALFQTRRPNPKGQRNSQKFRRRIEQAANESCQTKLKKCQTSILRKERKLKTINEIKDKNGARDRNRTSDTRIFNSRCVLSYGYPSKPMIAQLIDFYQFGIPMPSSHDC